jgi:fructose-bisphosphate aldolase class 1
MDAGHTDRNLTDDLRATAEDLIADAQRVAEIEADKGALPPEDPKVMRLSEESERLTDRMAQKAKAEKSLARQARRSA